MLSVICPVYNEERYIENCLASIGKQDFPKNELEILFVDGMSTDRTREVISFYSRKLPYIYLVDNPKRIVPCAMNIGITMARGEVIIRLDVHACYEPNYFSSLVRRLYELNADNVGTVCKTDVLNKTPKTLAIKEVLSNRFGVGNSVFRTGIEKVMQVDTVPFGCWKHEVFKKYGMYNEKLIRNQDIELSKRIIRGGGRIFIIPDSFCTYYARETFTALAKNNYANGKWNILTIYYTKEVNSLSLRHFIPLLFLLSLLIPLFIGIFWTPVVWIAVVSLFCYIILLGSVSLQLSTEKGLSFIRLLQSFIVLHLSYGYGSLMGIAIIPFVKNIIL
jgi:glycosyltransferase involved in cell wall biosynthesis